MTHLTSSPLFYLFDTCRRIKDAAKLAESNVQQKSVEEKIAAVHQLMKDRGAALHMPLTFDEMLLLEDVEVYYFWDWEKKNAVINIVQLSFETIVHLCSEVDNPYAVTRDRCADDNAIKVYIDGNTCM